MYVCGNVSIGLHTVRVCGNISIVLHTVFV